MLRIADLEWDDWNEEHIARHGVTEDEVEDVCFRESTMSVRIGRGRYRLLGQSAEGRYLMAILDSLGEGRFYVVTARDATDAERRRLRHWRGE